MTARAHSWWIVEVWNVCASLRSVPASRPRSGELAEASADLLARQRHGVVKVELFLRNGEEGALAQTRGGLGELRRRSLE